MSEQPTQYAPLSRRRRTAAETLIQAAQSEGLTTQQIEGFVAAELLHGILRDDAPAWLLAVGTFLGGKNRLFIADHLDRAFDLVNRYKQ